jgi:hypothetical protein
MVRDQEVEGSNPFAPTNLLESATYKMRESIERLVQGQDVDGSNPFAPAIVLFLNQCFTLRSQLRVLLHFTDNADNFGCFVWIKTLLRCPVVLTS